MNLNLLDICDYICASVNDFKKVQVSILSSCVDETLNAAVVLAGGGSKPQLVKVN